MMDVYRLINVGFGYSSGFTLNRVNIKIAAATITAFVGSNGSGKTSLLNILAFLDCPDTGVMQYKLTEVVPEKMQQFRRKIGYVQQNPYLLRGSVFRNIEAGLKLRRLAKKIRIKRVMEVMDALNISYFKNRIAQTLSGGEAQKVAIAQMLVLDPDVIILDEPFSHLDKQAISDLEYLIFKLRDELNKTILLTTHDKFQAQLLADEVYHITNGKILKSRCANLFSGTMDENRQYFDTGKLKIQISYHADMTISHISIDPKRIVLSNEKLDSSMQNTFFGKVISLISENDWIRIKIDVGEHFDAVINHRSLDKLHLSPGSGIWISFKSASVFAFE